MPTHVHLNWVSLFLSSPLATGPPFFSDGICMKMIKKYIACSFFRFTMRRLGRLQSTPDADLDIEHHLPYAKSHEKRARVVQADNARVRCYRVFIICE